MGYNRQNFKNGQVLTAVCLNRMEDALCELMDKLDNPSGTSSTASALLVDILRNAIYSTDQSANITALENALGGGTDDPDVPDVPDEPDEPVVTTYTITRELINVTSSNNQNSVAEGAAYTATLTADEGYVLDNVTVTMGGVDVTTTAWKAATSSIIIANVTGNLVVAAAASKANIQSEVLEIVYSTNYPDTTTFEWEEGSSAQYVVAKQGTIVGGLLSIDYSIEECAGFNLNLYCFDTNGNPYKYARITNNEAGSVTPDWGDPGTITGFGTINSPCTVQIPDGCTFIGCMRRGGFTGTSVSTNDEFKRWAVSGGITFRVTG